ncbi:MAG: peptide-binding protein [Desulfurivibrio sp.]|jgi:SH3-like domain-containing protein|nr:MAG: peptide-binding protein [Desulfurivibrio sp.]
MMNKAKTWQKRLTACLGVSLLTFAFSASAVAADYASVSKDGVNIRSGPDNNAEVYWEVFKDFPLKVLQRKNDWAKVEDFEGDTGWIYAPLLNNKKTVIIKVKKANIRVGPGENYEVAASALYGVVFNPGKTDGDWVQVSHADGTTGWINKSLIWP